LSAHRGSNRGAMKTATPLSKARTTVGPLLLGLGLQAPAAAQIYMAPGASGNTSSTVVLSDVRSELTPEELLAAPAEVARAFAAPPHVASGKVESQAPANPPTEPPMPRAPALPAHLLGPIRSAAQLHGVSAPLLAAVAAAESGFDKAAKSAKGARGLMQLMPGTASRFHVTDPFSARQSLEGGAAYLRWLHGRFGQDTHRVLAAYNAGEQAVARANGVPPFAETLAYVPRVLAYLRQYEALPEFNAAAPLRPGIRGNILPRE
jgi:soluble lytic murein transglycosylase-like protein